MNMVGHEAEGVHSIVETASPFLRQEIEAAATLVGKKDRLASVTSENDVVDFRIQCHFSHSGLDPESIACTNHSFRIKPGMTPVNSVFQAKF
jgi:hypothetical protein